MGMQFAFNAQQYNPSFGGGSSLPPGKYKVVISDTKPEQTKDGQGGYLAVTLKVVEGPMSGGEHIDRLNLHNVNQKAVEIAHERLAGYCVCIGVMAFQNTAELHNKPFGVEIGPQKDAPEYTEVKKLFDANGNTPVKGGGQPPAQPQAPNGFAPPASPPAPPPPPPPASGGWPAAGGAPQAPAGGGWPGGTPSAPPPGGNAPWGR